MKTITLSEEAYDRLLAWKETPKDSFSKVVDRVVPKRGTMGAALAVLHDLPAMTKSDLDLMEKEARSNRTWDAQKDPWGT